LGDQSDFVRGFNDKFALNGKNKYAKSGGKTRLIAYFRMAIPAVWQLNFPSPVNAI
jgi:hypothetical protein